LFFFALIAVANVAYAVGDIEVLAVDFNVSVGLFDNSSGGFNTARVDYGIEWYWYDSLTMPGTWPWQFMTAFHLAWAYRDTSDSVGIIEPVFCDWMENSSGERWPCEFGSCFDLLDLDTLHWEVVDSVDTVFVLRFKYRTEGTIFLPLPQGDLRLYLAGDFSSWDNFHRDERPGDFCGGYALRLHGFQTLNDYFDTYPNGAFHLLEHRNINVPSVEPFPPPDPGIVFDDWLLPNGTSGRNWLPVPGDTIGLRFYIPGPSPATGQRFSFLIWDISAWQGEAMNYPAPPVAAPWHTGDYFTKPYPTTGTDYDFDFWLADPDLFDIQVIDTLTQEDAINLVGPAGWLRMPDSLRVRDVYRSLLKRSRKSIIATTRTPVTGSFVLRLVARDYAAHCLVTPKVQGLGKSNFMQHVTSLGERVNHISVPRDEDGYEEYSRNVGDYLADAWEEARFDGDSLRNHWPFVHPDSLDLGVAKWEDDDYNPRGRPYDGDDLVNFEEYRGFWVAQDESNPNEPNPHMHVRCYPDFKDVFLYFHPALDSNQWIWNFFPSISPGYLYKLSDSIDIRVTDYSSVYGIYSNNITARRERSKPVSFARAAASQLMPPLFVPQDSLPLDTNVSPAQIVSIWPWVPGERIQSAFGWVEPTRIVFPGSGSGDGGTIPRFTNRILMFYGQWVRVFQTYDRYNITLNPNALQDWETDVAEGLRVNIGHETGHAVGLLHARPSEPMTFIMGPYRGSVHDSLGIHPRLPQYSLQDSSRFSTADR